VCRCGGGSQISPDTNGHCSESDRILGSKSGRVDCSAGGFTLLEGRFRDAFSGSGLSLDEQVLVGSEYELSKRDMQRMKSAMH